MLSPQLIGIMVGVLTAVLFASRESAGGYIAAILSFLMLLPLLLAGIGWGRNAAIIGMLVAGCLIGVAVSPLGTFEFAVYIGFPAVIFSQLVLLRRESLPDEETQASQTPQPPSPIIKWYPFGHIVAWATVMAGTVMALAVSMMEDVTKERESIQKMLLEGSGKDSMQQIFGPNFGQDSVEMVADIILRLVVPGFAGLFCVLVYLVNVWLALKILSVSGQLGRPWPDFAKLEYPPLLMAAFMCAIGISLQPGIGGSMAMAYVGAFAFAYLLLGLAVVHYWAASTSFPIFILAAVYIGLLSGGIMTLGLAITLMFLGHPMMAISNN
ncbi:MAG: DUF2232 domain-containing protein [Alphaproteobacteria bacterium]